jgi:hypothetical protein
LRQLWSESDDAHALVNDFLTMLLEKKPDNVYEFSRFFFAMLKSDRD